MSTNYASKLSQAQKQAMNYGLCGDEEIIESPEQLRAKVQQLADLIRNCRRCVVHTGAGVSTSAGIPDFRGKNGVWTCEQKSKPLPPGISFEDAIPTPTHMAIVSLLKAGMVHHVVTQNVDGLHMRSGMRRDQLSEIHGSSFALYCYECGTEYPTWTEVDSFGCAKTAHSCPRVGCGEALYDRICNWENVLPIQETRRAEVEHKRADLVIVLGCSLRVQPACNLLDLTLARSDQGEGRLKSEGVWEIGKKRGDKGRLVIVNLQATTEEWDSKACLRMHGKTDDVMAMLIAELGINRGEIPRWDMSASRAAFDLYCNQVVEKARKNPRTRNNGRWLRGHPPISLDDVHCYICHKAEEGKDSFVLCSTCDSGAHSRCLGAKRPKRNDDFFCRFCLADPPSF